MTKSTGRTPARTAPDQRAAPTDDTSTRDAPDSGPTGSSLDPGPTGSSLDPGPTEWEGVSPPAGVGPYPWPWPEDDRLDPEYLAGGDRRNVVDRYRYWRHDAIVADLDERRHRLEIAIENFAHDMNIGTVVRTANSFAVREVHIVGRRRWNRRGAMVTDRYEHLRHHDSTAALVDYAREAGLALVAVDNLPGAKPIENTTLPRDCLLAFGSESNGISDDLRSTAATTVSIAQFGSTRSINVSVAAGIAMHTWIRQYADLTRAW